MLYFIQNSRTRSIKIGYTSKPIKIRIKALQTNTPDPLKLLKTMSGNPDKEKELHQRFANCRLHGEWFIPSSELLEFIETIPEEEIVCEPSPIESIMSAQSVSTLKSVGELIRIARKRRDMSVSELASRINVDRRTLTQLENGNPSVSLGVFIQVLDLLNLLRGIEEIVRPENDMEAIVINVYKARRKLYKCKIDDSKVNF